MCTPWRRKRAISWAGLVCPDFYSLFPMNWIFYSRTSLLSPSLHLNEATSWIRFLDYHVKWFDSCWWCCKKIFALLVIKSFGGGVPCLCRSWDDQLIIPNEKENNYDRLWSYTGRHILASKPIKSWRTKDVSYPPRLLSNTYKLPNHSFPPQTPPDSFASLKQVSPTSFNQLPWKAWFGLGGELERCRRGPQERPGKALGSPRASSALSVPWSNSGVGANQQMGGIPWEKFGPSSQYSLPPSDFFSCFSPREHQVK